MELRWMLELSLELTNEEGEGILGAMYPGAWDQYLDSLNDPIWQHMEEEESLRELLMGLE
jgi:hypothetical protein